MRSLGTRRLATAVGVATVAVIGLAGCSAGQVAETALLKTPISGLNTTSPDGTLLVRNLQVIYNSATGYAAGSTAPLEVSLYNQTESPMTVLISSAPPQGDTEAVVSAQQIGVSGSAAPSAGASAPAPSASAPVPGASEPVPGASEPVPGVSEPAPGASAPGSPALQPARFTIPAFSVESFMPGDPQTLQATGLSGPLANGTALAVTIESSASSQPLQLLAPVAIPLSAGPRAPAEAGEGAEPEAGN